MKLDCNFEINNQIICSETYLEQKPDDCSIIATVLPHQIISDFTSDCFLESMIDSSDLLLDKTSGIISEERTKHTMKGNTQEYKVKLPSAKLEVDGVTFADLENVIEVIESICLLISFASGRMCSIARIQVLHDTKTVHLEYISPENTKLKEGNKVIYREEDVIQFIESTYTDYISNVNIYKLKQLIQLGILANNTPYIENKTLLICNFLEILRYNYALNVCHFTQKRDDFYWADKRTTYIDLVAYQFVYVLYANFMNA